MRAHLESRLGEPARQALDALRVHRARTVLAVLGILIGIVTVVVVASVLANARNQVALLFRELGTDNVFAFHLSGDPYSGPTEREAARRPLRIEFAAEIARRGGAVRDAAAQVIVPAVVNGQALVARAGAAESDAVLVEGATPLLFEITGAEFARGRAFTDLEDRAGAPVAVVGANLSRALFGSASPIGQTVMLAGGRYTVVGELAPRRGGFFGENRQDNVLVIPARTVRQRFGEPDRVVLYVRAQPGLREACRTQVEAILRVLRQLPPDAENDFNLSTADQIIAAFDSVSARIGLATVGLAAVSLLIGAIGVANVMFISVTERTREIGLRRAIGARRAEVLWQFLLEAAMLAGLGGMAGVAAAGMLGLALTLLLPGYSALPPAWAVVAGVTSSIVVGLAAGFWPARRAAALDPAEALRYE